MKIMAPNSSKNGKYSLLETKPGIPTRYRCKSGGEWKNLGDFSAGQQKNLQRLIDTGRRIDAAHSGMICMQHAASGRDEIQCDLCGLYKSKDDYSKNSRRNGEYNCKRCVAWMETQEPDVTPGPLETGHISPEEEFSQISRQNVWTIDGLLSDSSAPRYQVCEALPTMLPLTDDKQASVSALSSLNLDDDTYNHLLNSDLSDLKSLLSKPGSTTSSTSSNTLPPHLRDKIPSSSTSMASGPKSNLPPHLRAKFASISASVKDDAASVTSSTDASLPTTLREASSPLGSSGTRSFNAWDTNGAQHRLRPTRPETDTDTASLADELQDDDPNVIGDWENTAPVFQPGKKAGWIKGRDTRLSSAELRASNGEVYQNYISKSIDQQNRYRPLDVDDDSD